MVAITEWDVKVIKYQHIPTKKLIFKITLSIRNFSCRLGSTHRRIDVLYICPPKIIFQIYFACCWLYLIIDKIQKSDALRDGTNTLGRLPLVEILHILVNKCYLLCYYMYFLLICMRTPHDQTSNRFSPCSNTGTYIIYLSINIHGELEKKCVFRFSDTTIRNTEKK